MDELFINIRKKVKKFLNAEVNSIEKIENVPNNSVFKLIADNKPYIFKIYKQRSWPEDGKLIFVNNKLIENNIGCAKIIVFDRSDSYFKTGFLLEECLPGINADHIVFDTNSGTEFYGKLARLISNVHRINIDNYGYIGSGRADYTTFIDFMNDKYDEMADALLNKSLLDEKCLLEIKRSLMDKLRLCDELPSVLNHGDLSTKNVMIDEFGELTLIDWDDAMSLNWIADISRMTYWMKFQYNESECELYKNAFLESYSTEYAKYDFNDFENTFHIWIGLDHLNYYANTPKFDSTMRYFKETIKKLDD